MTARGVASAFFIEKQTGTGKGRKRKIKSCLGELNITTIQGNRLGLSPYQRYSPLLEKCCLLVAANESYQKAEEDIKTLTGIEVGHSSLQRKAQNHNLSVPDMKQKLSEISVDGGSVRLRGKKGEKCYWQQYKTARLQGIYYGAFFQDNLSLTDWINSQQLTQPFYCLGDGHDGIWNIFEEIGEPENRQEILDWYHLKENLYKLGGSRKRIKKLEELLWKGKVEDSLQLLRNKNIKRASQFGEYLDKHRHRIINYQYFQADQICSVG